MQSIGGEQGLINFLKKNKDVPCATCGTGGIAVFAGRNMDEMIENFVEVAHLYKDHPQLWSKLAQGAEHTLPAMREGTQHTLEIIRKNSNKYHPSRIESMDLRFEDLPSGIDLCVNCRYDIKFKTNAVGNGTPLFAEFKSYARSTWNNIATDTKFFSQFKNYISSVNKADELAYIINTNKASIDEVKTAFKAMFSNPTKKTEIFNAMKPELKESLQLFSPDDLTSNKIDAILNVIIKAE